MKPKPLQFFKSVDGEPGDKIMPGETSFEYDISLGKKMEFFIFNGNHNTSVNISKLFVNDLDITFHTQNRLMPLETAKCYIKIDPMSEDEVDKLVTLEEYTEDKRIHIEGEIEYKQLGIDWGDGEKLYGW